MYVFMYLTSAIYTQKKRDFWHIKNVITKNKNKLLKTVSSNTLINQS